MFPVAIPRLRPEIAPFMANNDDKTLQKNNIRGIGQRLETNGMPKIREKSIFFLN